MIAYLKKTENSFRKESMVLFISMRICTLCSYHQHIRATQHMHITHKEIATSMSSIKKLIGEDKDEGAL